MNPQTPTTPSQAKPVALALAALLIVSLIFGLWAFSKAQDYKKNSDAKAAAAVARAKQEQAASDQLKYDDLAKQPYKTYAGPTTYGTVSFNYPKNWSVYDDQTNQPINAYFNPDIVPGVNGGSSYLLRVELTSNDYSQVVSQYTARVSDGSLRSAAYIPPKLKTTANVQPGLKFDGTIGQTNDGQTQQGSMVIIKVRDKTLKIYTQTASGVTDFNNVVLPNLTFVP